MIITRTPCRISLLGGSSDYPSYYRKHEGLVVGGSVNLYSYVSVRRLPPFHDAKTRAVYSEIENVHSNTELKHRAIRETICHLGMEDDGLEIFHAADIPGRSGTGSSSSFVVGLLNGLATLQGKHLSAKALTKQAIHIEQSRMAETVGCQDQAFAAHGGLNTIKFHKNDEIAVYPLALSPAYREALESHLLLFFTRMPRVSSEVAKSYAHLLGEPSHEPGQHAMVRLAEDAVNAIHEQDFRRLGHLMDQSWRIKTKQSDMVSNDEIQRLYNAARILGAYGGKLTGAGGGGCIILVAPSDRHAEIVSHLEHEGCVHIPFKFEHDGSRVIFAA